MTETEKMQQLHHRATIGEELSPDEQKNLQNWYDKLDREEESINRNNRQVDLEAIRKRVAKTVDEIEKKSNENAVLRKQNEQIRRENLRLKEILESRLVEQAA